MLVMQHPESGYIYLLIYHSEIRTSALLAGHDTQIDLNQQVIVLLGSRACPEQAILALRVRSIQRGGFVTLLRFVVKFCPFIIVSCANTNANSKLVNSNLG